MRLTTDPLSELDPLFFRSSSADDLRINKFDLIIFVTWFRINGEKVDDLNTSKRKLWYILTENCHKDIIIRYKNDLFINNRHINFPK